MSLFIYLIYYHPPRIYLLRLIDIQFRLIRDTSNIPTYLSHSTQIVPAYLQKPAYYIPPPCIQYSIFRVTPPPTPPPPPLNTTHKTRILIPIDQRALATLGPHTIHIRPAADKLALAHDPRQLARQRAVQRLGERKVRGEEDVEVALVDLHHIAPQVSR